jgi:hypothetical protein
MPERESCSLYVRLCTVEAAVLVELKVAGVAFALERTAAGGAGAASGALSSWAFWFHFEMLGAALRLTIRSPLFSLLPAKTSWYVSHRPN